MLSYAFIFITLTLVTLVLASFWLKVPKASFPLLFIYLIFIFNNNESKTDSKVVNARIIKPSQEKVIVNPEKKTEPTYKELATIKPKPITFESDNVQEKITKKVKKEIQSEEKIKVLPKDNNKSSSTLVVKDIKICKKIYKRTPVGADIVFTNSVDSLYCYTRIQNTGSKKEVKHIWYFENQIMTQVRYNVKKSNIFRSWTKKTILPHQIGKWRVDVHDNHGTIIGSKEFQIKKISNYN
tara:strand:- start:3852 stop:4568 length:717 start_codon:yes stop_codon:yes gene_type:complete